MVLQCPHIVVSSGFEPQIHRYIVGWLLPHMHIQTPLACVFSIPPFPFPCSDGLNHVVEPLTSMHELSLRKTREWPNTSSRPQPTWVLIAWVHWQIISCYSKYPLLLAPAPKALISEVLSCLPLTNEASRKNLVTRSVSPFSAAFGHISTSKPNGKAKFKIQAMTYNYGKRDISNIPPYLLESGSLVS